MNSPLPLPIDVNTIRTLIPHRYPFLLVDKVVALDTEARTIVAHKNVTINEPFFQGHFPSQPIMPGVLIIEALAQAGGLLTQLSHQGDTAGRMFYMVKVENARFTRMVVPGDRLDLDVTLKRLIRNMAFYTGVASVNGEQVACADVLCAEDTR